MGAADLRERINDLHSYLSLAFALKGGSDPRIAEFKGILSEVGHFLEFASSREVKLRGNQLEATLLKVVEFHSRFLPRRARIAEIAADFRQLTRESNVWRYGVSYAWLCKRFVPEALPHPLDLPPHARVGIGPHSGNASVEELFLLEDTFLMFARAEDLFGRLRSRADQLGASGTYYRQSHVYRTLTLANAEVGTYSRLCVVTSAGFVEAFVNSVGWREAEKGGRTTEAIEQLRGRRKDRYLTLEAKLERFPRLIRADGIGPILVSDTKQMKEPFTAFFSVTKEVRDASMHYAPGKTDIWLPPGEWLARAELATRCAVEVAAEFWRACFPTAPLPSYLDELSYDRFADRARKRVLERLDENNPEPNSG